MTREFDAPRPNRLVAYGKSLEKPIVLQYTP